MMGSYDGYTGRLVGVGVTDTSQPVVIYRLASRSYRERRLVSGGSNGDTVVSVEKTQPDPTDNAFIEYPALIATEDFAIVANGTHSVPIRARLEATGDPVDSIESVLRELGYEDDGHATPRIAAAIIADSMAIGSVSASGLHVNRVEPQNSSLVTTSTNGQSADHPSRTVPLGPSIPHHIVADVFSNGAHHGLAALAYLTTTRDLALASPHP